MDSGNLVGTRLGKYELRAEIGRGGMGTVYKGYDPMLDSWVAVKVLAPHLVWEQKFVERFIREARAARKLRHPGIVTVYDVGQEAGWYYIVMEYLEGQTLTELIRERGPMPPEGAVRILRPLAEALDYAHHKGLVHRDVKPGNVIVDPAGQVTLTDFGIARAVRETRLTATGTVVGTPEYMSPEQVKGLTADARSDQYSLGVVAYEVLSGRVPFEAESTLALLHKVAYDPPPPIRQARPDLSVGVEAVLRKVLAKEPGDRYGTTNDFVEALGRALAGEEVVKTPTLVMEPEATAPPVKTPTEVMEPEVAAVPAPVMPPPAPAQPAAPSAPPALTPAPARRRRAPVWIWALGGLAVLALVMGIVMAVVERQKAGVTPTAAAVSMETSTPRSAATPTPTAAATAIPTRQPTSTPTETPTPIPTLTATAMPVLEFAVVPTVASTSAGLNGVEYYGFNTTLPPFDNPLVRQAFAAALDRAALSTLANNLSPERYRAPATTFTPPDFLGLDLYEAVGLPYNPDRARSLLAQAGYPDGSGLPTVTLWYNEYEYHQRMAESIRDQWQEVLGVEVILRSKPWDEYLEMLSYAPPQIWRLGWTSDYVDPHGFLHDAICGGYNDFAEYEAMTQAIANAPDEATRRTRIAEFSARACEYWDPTRFRWDNAEYRALLQTALQELDEEKQRELYVQAERILCETDAVVIPLFHYHQTD